MAPATDRLSENYEILRVIGTGTFGKVYLAKSKKDRQTYVIKKIPLIGMRPEEKEAANKEVRVLSQLKHPNIVGYYESFIEDGYGENLCIVMSYCEGGDLRSLIQKEKSAGRCFSEQQVLDWLVQILLALQYTHERKILHRDLKTQNIFLTKRQKILKIGDFGISRVLDFTAELATSVVGTPCYMSPEICEHKPYNHKSDVWAVGCILHEMCSLKLTFESSNFFGLIHKIMRGVVPPIPNEYSFDLRQLVERMLNRDTACRPSIAEILTLPFIKTHITKFLESTSSAAQQMAAAADRISRGIKRPHRPSSRAPSAGRKPSEKGAVPADHKPRIPRQDSASRREKPSQIDSLSTNGDAKIPRLSRLDARDSAHKSPTSDGSSIPSARGLSSRQANQRPAANSSNVKGSMSPNAKSSTPTTHAPPFKRAESWSPKLRAAPSAPCPPAASPKPRKSSLSLLEEVEVMASALQQASIKRDEDAAAQMIISPLSGCGSDVGSEDAMVMDEAYEDDFEDYTEAEEASRELGELATACERHLNTQQRLDLMNDSPSNRAMAPSPTNRVPSPLSSPSRTPPTPPNSFFLSREAWAKKADALRDLCEKDLGRDLYHKVYSFLRQKRFASSPKADDQDDESTMQVDLELVAGRDNVRTCYLVDQVLLCEIMSEQKQSHWS